jgi:hypothetical protein
MTVPVHQWDQFGGNPTGSGFRAVDSTAAAAPAWRVDIPGASARPVP